MTVAELSQLKYLTQSPTIWMSKLMPAALNISTQTPNPTADNLDAEIDGRRAK